MSWKDRDKVTKELELSSACLTVPSLQFPLEQEKSRYCVSGYREKNSHAIPHSPRSSGYGLCHKIHKMNRASMPMTMKTWRVCVLSERCRYNAKSNSRNKEFVGRQSHQPKTESLFLMPALPLGFVGVGDLL